MTGAFSSPLRNLVGGVCFMLVVASLATAAYVAQGWPLGDAAYMVVLTVYTVGYDEVRPIDTPALRAITIGLIVCGCTGMIFLTGALVQFITVSQFQTFFGVRRMTRDIEQLRDHVIICGYGRIGQSLAQDLQAGGVPFVIVDVGDARLAEARHRGFLALQGNATDEEVLKQVGIVRARALTTVLPDDAANVFITLSARSLNAGLTIIARGELPSTESKLMQAGADRVVLPAHIGAERIAELLLFRDMGDLRESPRLDQMSQTFRRLGLDLEIVAAAAGSRAVGLSLGEIERLAAGAFLVVALQPRGEATIVQPPLATLVEAGDGLAVVGRPTRAAAMEAIFR